MDQLITLYLLIFPLGKLAGNISDILILVICFFAFVNGYKFRLNNFLIICVFSLIFSLSFFKLPEIFHGILYFVRLVSYFLLSQIVYLRFGKNKKKVNLIFNSLIMVGLFIAIFGWVQYLFLPDLRFLKNFGWDDHYFRLVSTFFDPAFTGILLVLTEILIFIKNIQKNTLFNFFLSVFIGLSILFTYSRASYLALFFAILALFLKFRKKFLLFLIGIFILGIFLLPQPHSEGVHLTRTYSVNQKFINFTESFEIIKKSPVFGLGFDNICIAKLKFLQKDSPSSHTCSGLDNSILFIIATTGVVGLSVFINSILSIVKNTRKDFLGWGLTASFVAVFIHGMFTNTFFYSFAMGWVVILIGISRAEHTT